MPETRSLTGGFLLLSLVGGEDAVHQVRRDLFVVAGHDVEVGAATGDRTQVPRVGEHLDLGHLGLHHVSLPALLDAHRAPAPPRQVAHDVADELCGREDLDLDVRFQQDGPRLLYGVLERHGPRDLEGHLRGVHRVEGAVVEANLHVHDRVAGDGALAHRLHYPLLDRRDELARDRAPHYGVLELEALAARERGDLDPCVPELPPAACLLLVAALGLGGPRDRLLERHLGRPCLDLHPVTVLYALEGELDVHLREPGQDLLARRLGALQLERGVLVGDALYRVEDLLLLAAGLGPHRERRGRLRQLHRLEGHLPPRLAQGVEGARVLELGDGDDVAGDRLVHGHALLADEVGYAPEPLRGASARVGERFVRAAPAAHDPQDAQASRVRVLVGLEHVGGERPVRVAGDLLAVLGDPTRAVHGARGAARHHVEEPVNPDPTLRAGRQHGDYDAVGDALPYPLEHLLGRELLALEVPLQERVVALGYGLEELYLGLVYLVLHAGGDLLLLLPVHEGGSCQEPVDSPQVVLAPYGQVQRHHRLPEALP